MPFKECPNSRHLWRDRESFLSDPDLRLIDYQVNYGELNAGLFLFTHDVPACGTSLAIKAGKFTDMHQGPIFESRLADTERCAGHCLRVNDLNPCPEKCACAYVRDVLQEVKKRLKQAQAGHKIILPERTKGRIDFQRNTACNPATAGAGLVLERAAR